MACSNLTAGFTLDCNDAQGGIEKLFIANGPVESITEAAGVITAITVGGNALAPASFFVFETPRQTSSLTETITPSQENGTVTYDQQLTMIFNKMSATKRNQILLMAEATNMVCVAKDNDGKYWFCCFWSRLRGQKWVRNYRWRYGKITNVRSNVYNRRSVKISITKIN